ncbi:MAG: lipid II flippase MurJ [Acidobacteriota bacterium]
MIVTAHYFGASDDLDAFLTAFLIPSILVETATATFTPSFVPALIRVRDRQGEPAAHDLAQAGTVTMLAAVLPVAALMLIGGPSLLAWLGSGFSPAKLHTTGVLFFWMLLWLPFGALSATWRSVLNSHNRVALAACLPLLTPVISVLLLSFSSSHWGIRVLPAAVVAGAIIEAAMLAAAVHRLGYRVFLSPRAFRASMTFTPELRLAWGQYGPQLAGAASLAVAGLIDQAVAGSLGSGSVSALSFGTRVSSVMIAIGGSAVATAVLPEFSRLSSTGQWAALRRAVRLTLLGTTAVMVAVAVGGILFAVPIVRLIYERGAFDAQSTEVVASIQRLAFLNLPGAAALGIIQRLTAAVSSASLLIRAGVAALLVNTVGDFLLPRWLGIGGIALASVLAHLAFLIALTTLLYIREPRLFRRILS